ncbi:MAG: hemolysin family protein [Candidatus Woesearchaeota archaeon]
MTIEIIILILCFFFSGFFSGVEAAFFSVSKLDVKQLKAKKVKNIDYLEKLKLNPHRFIITVLIGNNVANILAASLATKIALDAYGDVGVGIATGAMTLFVLIFGEIIPKAYCSSKAKNVTLKTSKFLTRMAILLTPAIIILDAITIRILRIFGISSHAPTDVLTEDAVREIIQISAEDGAINSTEKEFITNVLEFDDITVNEVMIHKEHVEYAFETDELNDVLRKMMESGFSRLPVFKEDKQTIVGTIHIKDILKNTLKKNPHKTIQKLVGKPYIVPETKKINTLFKGFQKRQVHMAIVVNEYGSFEGIVTLEDVLEEIVGEVQDESDVETAFVEQLSETEFHVRADCYIEEFNKHVGTHLVETDDYETIGGYILTYIGRIPKKNEVIKIKNLVFKAIKVSTARIIQLKVTKK